MSGQGGRMALMEDDTVLCADCLHDYQDERLPETAATMVHAWLAGPVDEACRCCGAIAKNEGVS
ncbi:MAG: hypothetical protein QOD83_3694 [Solirubrobacteraceae bacterium]|jgi:hypothetical protein|nr:hypothetical protein [Solirubrobacteraceae bacterium]